MSIFTNLFSGITYFTSDSFKASTEHTYVKSGDTWISDQGQVIIEQDDGYLNMHTGVHSTWGDPFEEKQ